MSDAPPRDPAAKVHDLQSALRWRALQAGRVVFTNGVFDLLHPGHVDVLFGARRCGDALIVGLNSDASVRRIKGPERPVRNEAERAYVLAAFETVDAPVYTAAPEQGGWRIRRFGRTGPTAVPFAVQTPFILAAFADGRKKGEFVIAPGMPGPAPLALPRHFPKAMRRRTR